MNGGGKENKKYYKRVLKLTSGREIERFVTRLLAAWVLWLLGQGFGLWAVAVGGQLGADGVGNCEWPQKKKRLWISK